jgi:hypothetical protein
VQGSPTPTPRPILVIFDGTGTTVSADLDKTVKPAFESLATFCKIKAYKTDGSFAWAVGNLPTPTPCAALKMTSAIRSDAAGSPGPSDPVNLMHRVAFANLDDMQQFFSKINPQPSPSPSPTPTPTS